MKILIEQNGYKFENLGDLSMLLALVTRIRSHSPAADISILSADKDRCHAYVPDANPIDVRLFPNIFHEKVSAALGNRLRVTVNRRSRVANIIPIRRIIQKELAGSAAVVYAGGGGINDTFFRQARAAINLLEDAQALGIPTAMFGQGVGPITNAELAGQVGAVMSRCDAVGLRTPVDLMTKDLIDSPAVDSAPVGDDALELAYTGEVATGGSIGVNFRPSRYAGSRNIQLETAGRVISRIAISRNCKIQGLPVSFHSDEDSRSILGHFPEAKVFNSPDYRSMVAAISNCSIVVTMSYHAAVFALAQGVPAVLLTGSKYYDSKFYGLQALYGSPIVQVVPILDDSFDSRLDDAIEIAKDSSFEERGRALARSASLLADSRKVTAAFLDKAVSGVGA